MHPFATLAIPAGSVGIHWFEQSAYALKDSQRTYDPQIWASLFPVGGPKPLIIPWNSHIIYPVKK